MRKYEEEHYKYENIKEKIYPWVKSELTDSQALNGKHISEKDTLVVSFMEDLSVIFVIKRGEDVFEVLKDNMLPPDCDIEELYHASCENLIRDVEFVIANTWYGGFGIIADGHHEASALCFKPVSYTHLDPKTVLPEGHQRDCGLPGMRGGAGRKGSSDYFLQQCGKRWNGDPY